MRYCLLVSAFLLINSARASAQLERLHGMWQLVSAVTTVLGSGETLEPFGAAPRGYLTYAPEGRMQVIITADQRPQPTQTAIADMTDREAKDLLRTVTAYAGRYSFDGAVVTHHIEIAWNQVWSGTDQARDARFDADKLILTTKPGANPRDGRLSTTALTWERVR